jgi:methyl-accepting chemotaxis protein
MHTYSIRVEIENENALTANDMALQTIRIMNLLLYSSTTHKMEGFKKAEKIIDLFKKNLDLLKQGELNNNSDISDLDELAAAFDHYCELGKEMAFVYLTEGVEEGAKLLENFDRAAEDLTVRMKIFQGQKMANAKNSIRGIISSSDNILKIMSWMNGLAILLSLLISFFITRSITKPVGRVVSRFTEIAVGEADLTKRIKVEGRDEISVLAKSFNQFAAKLEEIIRDFKTNAVMLKNASDDLAHLAVRMASGADDMAGKSANASGSAEEMAASIDEIAQSSHEMSIYTRNVSAAAEQIAQSMANVTAAIDETDVSMGNIAVNARTGADISEEAMQKSIEAAEAMSMLNETSAAIGKVTFVIKRIAEQTRLLGLNANIQATSAGEAGKGFAVIANQIKELADKSGRSAQDIAQRIAKVRNSNQKSIKVISGITDTIDRFNTAVNVINSAVEQQTLATGNIASNVQQVNKGTGEIAASIAKVSENASGITMNIGQAAVVVNDVSGDIQSINSTAGNANADAGKVNTAASELALIAKQLQTVVEKFKIDDAN